MKRVLKSLVYWLPDPIFIRLQYYKNFKRFPNLKNPRTFNEKIQWKKLNDRKDIYTKLADKLEVRNFIEQKIGKDYLVKLYDVIRKPSSFSTDNLPKSFVAKANHASGLNLLVNDKEDIDIASVKKKFSSWLQTDFYKQSREWQYKNIPRAIVIEEFLHDENGNPPNDYKFHCFNGLVEFIQVDIGRYNSHCRNIYDIAWKLQPFLYTPIVKNSPKLLNGEHITRPRNLKLMIKLAEKISSDFNYVRVDFYNLNNVVLFGELTFHPGNGLEPFFPSKFDAFYGKKLNLIEKC